VSPAPAPTLQRSGRTVISHRVGLAQDPRPRPRWWAALALLLLALGPAQAAAQRVITQPERVVSVSKGASALLVNPVAIQRFSVGEPNVAEALVLSPTEVLINGKSLGTTTLFVWDNASQVRVYSVEVTADAPALQRYIRGVLPEEDIEVNASGNSVTLSGTVRDPNSVSRAIEIARASGATIVDNLVAPPAVQVLLKVRFAEVNRSVIREFSTRLSQSNSDEIDDNTPTDWRTVTSGDGTFNFFLTQGTVRIDALINALKTKGLFKSLAEPNLMTLPNKEAYFLAGGRFPFPTIQGSASGGNNAVTITFEEFGVKLRFTPTITRSGAIRLKLEPEVSSLDFANGLVISGFEIPTILTRKASTEVELREGQFLAIAGLMDHSMIDNATKIPILGDIPIIGSLFRSKSQDQTRNELLVLVSPSLVQATDAPPALPTGEPSNWKWDGFLKGPANPAASAQPAPRAPEGQ
jgi:pilus assembly protein CpaC